MRHVSAISLCALLTSFGSASAQDLEINNADEFVDFVNEVNEGRNIYERKTVVLSADIDLSSYTISPIGNLEYGFRGHFDGQGHTISGVVISSQEQYTGLFGQMYWYGSIRNVVLDETSSIKSTFTGSNVNSFAGGILGGFWGGKDEDFYIENCVNMASVTFSGNTGTGGYSLVKIGGIAGSLDSGNFNVHVVNCVNKGTISYGGTSDYPYVGGIIGCYSSNASIAASSVSRCANYGTVKSGGAAVTLGIGGVVGRGNNNFVVEKSVNYGMVASKEATVSSYITIGGVVGEGYSGSGSSPAIVRNCENYGEVSESANTPTSEFGGIVGRFRSTASTCPCKISNCVNNGKLVHNGTVSDSVRFGGITGFSWLYNEIENCMNFGNLVEEGNKGSQGPFGFMGGITGVVFNSKAKNCANYGDMEFNGNTKTLEVGGIFGRAQGSGGVNNVRNCLNHGNVRQGGKHTTLRYGGIIGLSDSSIIDNCVGSGDLTYTSGDNDIGGLIGFTVTSIMTNDFWKNSISSSIGYLNSGDASTITESYAYSISTLKTSSGSSIVDLLNNADASLGYAKWAQNTAEHAVTVVVNGRSFAVQSKRALLFPAFVEFTEEKFGGWYSDKLTSVATTAPAAIAGATTLYGAYGTLHKITFKYGSPVTTVVSTQAEDETLLYPDYILADEGGYTFKWCNDDESVCNPKSVPGSDITLTGKLYGKTYTATFKNGYDESDTTTERLSQGKSISYPKFTRTGYTLSGWSSSVTVTGDKMPASDVTFTAQWTPISYTATFKNGYDESGTTTAQYHYNDEIVFPQNPTRTGYTFDKWESDDAVSDNKMPANNVTFTAQWTPITYTATFKNGYDESGTTTAQYHYNDEIVFPQNPTRTGYTFDKWESDITVSDSKMPASNVTFTAQWTPITYIATFKNGYDESDTTTKQIKYGETIVYPTLDKTGYTLSGWSSSVTVTGDKMPANNVTFTAQWTPITYTATFKNGYDESGTTTAQYHYNDEIVYPQNPTRTGYTFDKWESDVTVSDNKMPASNVTFTAQWILIPVSSSSSSQEATSIVQITFGKVDISKEEMVKKIEAFIDADEGTYEIKEITSGENEESTFIVIFKDVKNAKQFTKNIQ